ncbi:MAG: LytTR family transcriptional regulator DNA-binding domain-containing protein [Saprospiraceae bacterium]|nr:LytTR family transcriptional regulator DNA-binding domain-containing protein [Saprospiraceae bacterium]
MHYSDWRGKLLLAIFPGIFVALFLNIFQPFTVNNEDGSWVFSLLIAGYGLLATLIILLTEFAIKPLSTRWLGVKGEGFFGDIFWYVWHFVTVAIGMMLYRVFLCHGTLQWPPFTEVMTMLYRTAMIGFIPMILLILGRKVKQQSTLIQDLDRIVPVPGKILLSGENGKEQLVLESQDLLYISNSDNYVEVYYQLKGQQTRMLLRSTMTRMEALLQTQPHIIRSHRSYIVNLHQVTSFRVKGKGLQLSLRDHTLSIPVSSKYKESVLRRIRRSNVPV